VTFGTNVLKVLKGSLKITYHKNQTIDHYPGTSLSRVTSLGKMATEISCTLVAEDETELILIEQILHGSSSENLILGTRYYKSVVASETFEPEPQDDNKDVWYVGARFSALDPVPYSVATNGALY